MESIPREITIYEAAYDDRVYVAALSCEEAKTTLTKHYAFGKPEDSSYALGDHWATAPGESGWRIVERRVSAIDIEAEQKGDFSTGETVHLIWTCPFCRQSLSEDLNPSDESPMLLTCSCDRQEKYFLANF